MSQREEPTLIEVDARAPDRQALEPAAEALREGRLVAFPTETVYGLGADASNEAAVARIFEAKDRPSTHPVIVHVASAADAAELAAQWGERASRLAERFWPGPLTLIVECSEAVSSAVTGGLETVGLRIPAHPVARALIEEAGVPVAAPSANPHQGISPTRAEHVVDGLGGRVDVVVDGGPTEVGIESTVLSLAVSPPQILRPGQVTRSELKQVVADVEYGPDLEADQQAPRPSPGMAATHYTPRARVVVARPDVLRDAWEADDASRSDGRVGWMALGGEAPDAIPASLRRHMPRDPSDYAAQLYDAFHELDAAGCAAIWVEMPPDTEPWRAVRNRLWRAGERP